MFKRIMFIVLIFLAIVIAAALIIGASISGPKYKGDASDHFDGKKFFTPGAKPPEGFGGVLKWMTNRERGEWTEDLNPAYGPHPLAHEEENIRITFINHSTFLIQVDGLNILTDPIFSKRASPFDWAGPKRMRLPGIRFEDLPRIDAVLISHNHYDHLDIATLRTIFGGHHPKFITPLGVKAFLENESITGVTDLDWWEKIQLPNALTVQAVPAQHFSGRGFLDRDATLWCGYVLKTSKGSIYFAGDTGYHPTMFKEIGEKTGAIKISLIPIGAYKPYWFMSPVHTSPEDAVKVHLDLKSQNSVGIHFGTFPLADEGYAEPVNDLTVALEKHNVDPTAFVTLKQGEVKVFE
jgi:L-ascorbate metabolism protein UlaG (beta-lactamase superfamily)